MKKPKTNQQKTFDRQKRKTRYGRNWDQIRESVYQRDSFRCRACGRAVPEVSKINAHHILLLRVSQTNDIRNLITLCDECHRSVENKGLAILKHGGHSFEVVRMTYRWLAEWKVKRQQQLLEELESKFKEKEEK